MGCMVMNCDKFELCMSARNIREKKYILFNLVCLVLILIYMILPILVYMNCSVVQDMHKKLSY